MSNPLFDWGQTFGPMVLTIINTFQYHVLSEVKAKPKTRALVEYFVELQTLTKSNIWLEKLKLCKSIYLFCLKVRY